MRRCRLRIPMPPPKLADTYQKIVDVDPQRFIMIMEQVAKANISEEPYLPWDKFRYHAHPENLGIDEWWFVVRNRRNAILRSTSLLDLLGKPFTYALRVICDIHRIVTEGTLETL